MAEVATDAPGVVVHAPVVADPETHAADAKERAESSVASVKAGGDGNQDPDEVISLDRTETPADSDAEAEGEGEAEPDAADGEDDDADAEGEGEATGEVIEFDFGGNKLEVPKDSVPPEVATKLQDFSKGIWADYTRKSQENAAVAKSNEVRGESIERLAGLNGEALQTFSTGLILRQEIGQLQAIDLEALWQSPNESDRDQARQISDRLGKKQAQFQEVLARVGGQDTAITEAQQAELARRSEEGVAALNKSIPEFSTKHAPDVVAYAVAKGMPQAEADAWAVNPMLTTMAYKAMLYDRMASKTPKAGDGTPRIPAKAVPAKARGGGRATGPSDPNNMSLSKLAKHLDLPG